jgi:transposase
MAGIVGASRRAGQALCPAVCGLSLSQGAVQQMVDRVSAAILPHDTALGEVARTSLVNYIDETSWRTGGDRRWLWGMAHPLGADCQRSPPRSQGAFAHLIADWTGVLVRDGSLVDQSWQGLRQRCLAPRRRTAQGLAESVEAGMARCGERVPTALQRLGPRGTQRPTVGQWRAWYARFRALVPHPTAREGKAGTLARRLARAGESLWVLLDGQGVEATQNIAARAHRWGGVAQAGSRTMPRAGPSLGGEGAGTSSPLSPPRASNIADAGRSRFLSVARRKT